MENQVKLTKLAQCAGCGAKVGAGTLAQLLEGIRVHSDPNLLVGFDKSDDASVYRVSDELALVQTVDFFPPIADDPYTFGQIAATNALSDVYAMGGEPKLALNIMCVPEKMEKATIHQILRGGYDKAYEAGAIITGGHSIFDDEPKYGLAVTGFVHPDRVLTNSGARAGDVAVLYRTNAQSNAMEFALKRNGIPYRVIGGTRFFDRAEVKDMLSYLCVINNRADDLRLGRIINNPPRGLGAKTIETARRLAEAEGKPLYSVISDPYSYAPLEKSAIKMMQFSARIEGMAQLLEDGMSLPDFYDELLIRTGYVDMLESKDTEENKTRLENVRELKSSINSYVENAETPTLAGFLEEIALYTDLEQYNENDDAVVMMTMHSAKGLEFPHVFLVGFEDGLFPGMRAIGDAEEMEEERRLCYVAITRAKQSLTITHARQRMIYGRTSSALPSRFLREIPEECIVKRGGYHRVSTSEHNSYSPYGSHASQYKKPRSSILSAAPTAPAPCLELNQGDMVMHATFGRGLVLSVRKMGGDALLEIAFDDIGTKKLMAKTASAHMKKL